MKIEIKKLQELYCWYEFYQQVHKNDEAKKVQEQITEHKKKHKLY